VLTLENTGNVDFAGVKLWLSPFVSPEGDALPPPVATILPPYISQIRVGSSAEATIYINLANTDVRATGYVATLLVDTGAEERLSLPMTVTVPTRRVYRYDLTQDGQVNIWDVQALIDYWHTEIRRSR